MINCFFNWGLLSFFLSMVVYVVFLSLKQLNFRSSNRYLFLKIAFLTLPLQAILFQVELPKYESQKISVMPINRAVSVELPKIDIISSNQSSQFSMGMWSVVGGVLFGVYLLGLIFGLFKIIVSYGSLARLKRASKPIVIDETVLFVHGENLAPAAFGMFNPCILLPKKLISSLTKNELEMVVRHEKEHIDRHDPLFNILRHLVRVVLFFNPIVRQLSHNFEEDMEFSLDESLVIKQKVGIKNYGEILIDLCSVDLLSEPIVCNGLSQKLIKRRILSMKNLNNMKNSQRLIFFALGVVATIGISIPIFNLGVKSNPILSSEKTQYEVKTLKLFNGEERKIKVSSKQNKVDLDYFLVNLASHGSEKLIKIKMDFEVDGNGVQNEIDTRMSQVRDIVVILISSKTFKQISTSDGKKKLKDEIRDTVNSFLTQGKIQKVYFTQFIFS